MSQLRRIAEYISRGGAPVEGSADADRLKIGAIDSWVSLIAGAKSPEGGALLSMCLTGNAERAGTAAAIIRSTEVDDIHLASCTTPSSVAAAVTLMDEDVRDPSAILDAMSIGIDVMVRFGLAINGPSVLYKGVWPTCFAAPMASAAVRSKLRGLTVDQTKNALSLALMGSSGRLGRIVGAPSGRWLLMKGAVMTGVQAADAAAIGYKGDPLLLDGSWLESTLGQRINAAQFAKELEEGSVVGSLSMKPHSTARQALAPTSALQKLLADGLDPTRILAIRVSVPSAYAQMISQSLTTSRSSGYVNAAFQMALAALRPDALWDLDRSEAMLDASIRDFAAKVSVEADESLDAVYPRLWPARIAVTTTDGVLTHEEAIPPGDPSRPLSRAELETKHRALLRQAGLHNVEALMDSLSCGFQSSEHLSGARSTLIAALSAPSLS